MIHPTNNLESAPLTRVQVAELAGVPDEILISRYIQGDKGAFSTLVARYQRELYHFLARFLSDRVAADDVFQESFLQVHESASTFDTTRRFRPWLFTIAANKARDYLRSRSRHPAAPLDAPIHGDSEQKTFIDLIQAVSEFPEEPLAREELRVAVQKTIEAMPANLREVLLLGHFHDFSYKHISDMLQIPLGTVKSRLHAAVAYFAREWKLHHQNIEARQSLPGK
jgi:RNA polymerase sigma-70 factor (ECF subfamily)